MAHIRDGLPAKLELRRLLNSALIFQSSQLWTHHRHLETQRSQYLGFFFTAIFASVGFAVAVGSRPGSFKTSWMLDGDAALAFLLSALSFSIYAAVRKIGVVLRFYDAEITFFYEELFGQFDGGPKNYSSRRIAAYSMPPLMKTRLYSTQGMAQSVLAGSTAVFASIQAAIAGWALFYGHALGSGRMIAMIPFGLTLMGSAYYGYLRMYHKKRVGSSSALEPGR